MEKKNEKRINEMFERLVPAMGKAETVAGEIVRAMCRIGYRWSNDGDMIGQGYGKETCNPAARFLAAKCDEETAHRLWILMYEVGLLPDDLYEEKLDEVLAGVLAFLDAHPELEETWNEENMFDFADPDEDRDDCDEDEYDEW